MITSMENTDCITGIGFFGPATVVGFHDNDHRIRIVLNDAGEGGDKRETTARTAIHTEREFEVGDTVLAAGNTVNDLYIIGILKSIRAHEPRNEHISLHNGVRAEVSGSSDDEKLSVWSEKGHLLFEYDPDSGKTRVAVPHGDLEIDTGEGGIVLSSSKDIRLVSSGRSADTRSAVVIDPQAISMNSPRIGIGAEKGSAEVGEMTYTGRRFSGTVGTVRLMMTRIESAAETVIEKAKNVYQTVEGLTQLCTGRMRTIVNTTFHMKSNRTFMKSEDDFKIKGEKIYLG